ncbi:hypothetical protein ACVJGD_004574 [Bradyrhizobium sp. USDA 10063]
MVRDQNAESIDDLQCRIDEIIEQAAGAVCQGHDPALIFSHFLTRFDMAYLKVQRSAVINRARA